MATQIKNLQFRIAGEVWKDYDFTDISLVQELLSPNEFRFSMKKKIWEENEEDIKFSVCGKLLGAKISCTFSTLKDIGSVEVAEETFSFDGIIVKAENYRINQNSGNTIEVLAYSPDYLLYDHPHFGSYEEKNLEEIVSDIFKNYDVEKQITPRSTQIAPYIVQYNETAYDFLIRLAQRYGEWFYYSGDKLIFGELETSKTITLKYPQPDLTQYHYSVELEHFNFFHTAHSYLKNESLSMQAKSFAGDNLHAMTDAAYNKSLAAYKRNTLKETDHAQESDTEQNTFENYLRNESMSRKAQLMVCHASSNRAELTIGSKIQIAETIRETRRTVRHEELVIIRIVHSFTLNGGYQNEFSAITANTQHPPYHSTNNAYPIAETQRATVIDNKDPEQMGRIRVQFLWQEKQDLNMITPWIRMTQPHGGNNKGFYFIPEIGEEVMAAFEMGNPERPYVTGTLYHGQARPGDNWYSDSDDIKAIRTRNGHTIEIHDVGEGGFIKIYDNEKENYILTYSTDEKLIKLESTGNIELYAENDIIMEAGKNIYMHAIENDVYVEAGNDINEKAEQNINLIATEKNIDVRAGDNINMEAKQDVDFDAGNNMSLVAAENMDIKNKNYFLSASQKIEQKGKEKMSLQTSEMEQKADNSLKIDGGNSIDMSANNVNIR